MTLVIGRIKSREQVMFWRLLGHSQTELGGMEVHTRRYSLLDTNSKIEPSLKDNRNHGSLLDQAS